MNILAIGGTRFMGPEVVRRLVRAGHEVAVFHRGRTAAEVPAGVREILGDRNELARHAGTLRRMRPDVVLDMVLMNEEQARALVETFRGMAGRLVVASSQDVYRAYDILHGKDPGPPIPGPIAEDGTLRERPHPYRHLASGVEDPLWHYDKIPAERVVLGERELPGTVLRLPAVHGPRDPQHRLFPFLKRMDDRRPASFSTRPRPAGGGRGGTSRTWPRRSRSPCSIHAAPPPGASTTSRSRTRRPSRSGCARSAGRPDGRARSCGRREGPSPPARPSLSRSPNRTLRRIRSGSGASSATPTRCPGTRASPAPWPGLLFPEFVAARDEISETVDPAGARRAPHGA